MNNIKLLDCTLRDGGYINEWKFGSKAIGEILYRLGKSGIDVIECGFMTDKNYDPNYSLFHDVKDLEQVMDYRNEDCLYVGMIAIGEKEIHPSRLTEAGRGVLGGIRLTFHQNELEKAFHYGKIIMEKGYRLFMQPVGSSTYTDNELISLIEKINVLKPYAFYIVDTLGTMYKKDLFRQFSLVDHNLDPSVRMGFHTHNNLQLSFANAQELLNYDTHREVIIDCSAYGMGRAAGNLCSELFMDYMNKCCESDYDILPVMEIIDRHLMPIYRKTPWGYSSIYFLAASYGCHPNYASYLQGKNTLNMITIGSLLKKIPVKERRFFNKRIVEQMYLEYQGNAVEDMDVIQNLRRELDGKEILLLGSGKSIVLEKRLIKNYIDRKNPLVISVNFIPSEYESHLCFFGNNKRYETRKESIDVSKTIFSSNIKNIPEEASVVNYLDLVNMSEEEFDSSGIMLLRLLSKLSVKKVVLAGFDGFKGIPQEQYWKESFAGVTDPEILRKKNQSISAQLNDCMKQISIRFLTHTKYKIELSKEVKYKVSGL